MSDVTYTINDKPMTSDESILTAFDAGSISVVDWVMETIGSVSNDDLFTVMDDFRAEILTRMNDRVPGSGDLIGGVSDGIMAEKLDFGD